MTIRIVTDSTADLSPELARSLDITVVPLNVHFGPEVLSDGIDIDAPTFYRRLTTSRIHPTTSQPSAGVFAETYGAVAEHADAIVSIHVSAKLSGTYNSAMLGVQEAHLATPVQVIDSRSVSLALGLVVIATARTAQQGAGLEEVVRRANEAIERVRLLFVLDTLEYLQRGGRIGKARAFLGTLIQVKPLLTVREGEIHPARQVRTRARAQEALYEWALQQQPAEAMAVVYSTGEEDARAFSARLKEALGPASETVELLLARVGPVLGVHAGPGCLGVAVLGR